MTPAKRNQMERILAAPVAIIPAGGQQNLTFQADQGQTVQINRMCLMAFGNTAPPVGAGATGPTANALGSSLVVSGILIRNTSQMVRSTAAGANIAGVPLNVWSPYRAYTGQGQFADQGHGLRLEAGEPIIITIDNLSDLAGAVVGGIPTILDCDKGRAAYPAGFDSRKGSAILASAVNVSGAVGPGFGAQVTPPMAVAVQWPEAGGLDLSQLLVSCTGTAAFAGPIYNNTPLATPNSLLLNQIQLIDQSVLVTGQGANIRAPGAMLWGGSSGSQLKNNWIRTPFQTGTSGNQVIVTLQAVFDPAVPGGFVAASTASGPFYPSVGSRPPIGCI